MTRLFKNPNNNYFPVYDSNKMEGKVSSNMERMTVTKQENKTTNKLTIKYFNINDPHANTNHTYKYRIDMMIKHIE